MLWKGSAVPFLPEGIKGIKGAKHDYFCWLNGLRSVMVCPRMEQMGSHTISLYLQIAIRCDFPGIFGLESASVLVFCGENCPRITVPPPLAQTLPASAKTPSPPPAFEQHQHKCFPSPRPHIYVRTRAINLLLRCDKASPPGCQRKMRFRSEIPHDFRHLKKISVVCR